MSSICVVKNKRIIDFYTKNTSLNFETVNLLVIDLLDQIIDQNNSKNVNSTQSQIFETINDFKKQFETNNTQLLRDLSQQITNMKHDYLNEYKTILCANNSTNNDKIESIIQSNSNSLIDKTSLLFHDILPKHNNYDKFFKDFDNKYNQMLQPIFSLINSTEDRIKNEITCVKNSQIPEPLLHELTEFFNKFRNSSYKGQLGEMQLENVLNQLYPSAEILNTSSLRASCDFKIIRIDKECILIETKDYDRNVSIDEVKKFIRDVELQKQHGIFLSQHSGITSKQNFHMDIHGKNIVIYIHNVKYDPIIIRLAIDIIDNLCEKMAILNNENEDDYCISEETFKLIYKEYNEFVQKKINFIESFKESNKRLLNLLDDIKFPCLSKILTQNFGTILNNENQLILCNICNKFQATNNKSLAAHQRGCKRKNNSININ